ncbi:HAMP domain-containing sensor histidine kinase [Ekhidna sp.]|uniref:sensor histidine kinase n=1 Tax=Ekhidna sp. TaxID=2608089 RepID=UPI00329A1558
MGLFGSLGTIHVAINLMVRKRLVESVNLLAVYANIMFLVEVIFSGGISSPALYWLMLSPFYVLTFSDYEVNKISIVWIIVSFTEFIALYVADVLVGPLEVSYPPQWHEALVLLFAITFMCYCSVVILLDVKARKEAGRWTASNKSNIDIEQSPLENQNVKEVSKTANKLHRRMVWIAIILMPIFPDYLFFEDQWMSIFSMRIGIVLYLIMVVYANTVGKLSFRSMAYACLLPLVIFLSYATSQVPLQNALVYNINYSAVFIISSFFLLWEWRHSLLILVASLLSYLIFAYFFNRLDLECFIEDGAWLLFSIGFASIFLTRFRYIYHLKELSFKNNLEKKNKKLSYQNNQLKQLNKKLSRSEEKLKESSLIKDKFFSIISHDLRSPIGTVSNFIKLINDDAIELTKEKEKEIFNRLESSLKNVEMLIDNLLNWAKSQMGILKLKYDYFEISEVANRCIELFNEELNAKSIISNIQLYTKSIAYGDERIVEFVIRNLLANAIKYSNEGGVISIECIAKNDYLHVSVTDSGVGMSDEDIKSLLDPNTHFTKPGTNKEMGTGLGMQLCIDFVKKNKGKLLIESKIGHGSRFTFTLPLFKEDNRLIKLSDPFFDISHN